MNTQGNLTMSLSTLCPLSITLWHLRQVVTTQVVRKDPHGFTPRCSRSHTCVLHQRASIVARFLGVDMLKSAHCQDAKLPELFPDNAAQEGHGRHLGCFVAQQWHQPRILEFGGDTVHDPRLCCRWYRTPTLLTSVCFALDSFPKRIVLGHRQLTLHS